MSKKKSTVHLRDQQPKSRVVIVANKKMPATSSTVEIMRQRARKFDEERQVWLRGIPA